MKRMYRFGSIKSEIEFKKVCEHIATELEKLSNKLFNKALPITTLKVFPHYPEEYKYLHKLVTGMGEPAPFNSATSYYTKVKRKIKGYDIKYLGVRIVDPYRLHVGCGDYEIDNFDKFRKKNLGKSDFVREFAGAKNMLEIWHPDFDVLGYVIPTEE